MAAESIEASQRHYGFPDAPIERYLRKNCQVSQKWKIVLAQDGNWDIFGLQLFKLNSIIRFPNYFLPVKWFTGTYNMEACSFREYVHFGEQFLMIPL